MPLNSPAVSRGSNNLRGILAMLGAMACFVSGDSIVKFASRELPTGEIMFLRGLFASCIILVAARASGALRYVHLALTPAMALRTVNEVGATFLFFSALSLMPLADANAVGQFTPLAVTAGAALFFGEKVGWRRWLATGVGLLGVVIIIRPGSSAFNWGAIFVIASVVCVTVRDLVTRQMGLALPALLIAAVSSIGVTLSGLALLPFETWSRPSGNVLFLLGCAGFCISGGYYGIITAMRAGEISVVSPFRYTATLFAVAAGYFIFSEIPDAMTAVGIVVVMAAGLYTLHRERVRMREHRKAASG
jgi:drug/metabolite transporter (DMT)-like permease